MEISEETAAFLLTVLGTVTLSVGAPDFEQTAEAMIRAKRELTADRP